MLGLLQVSPHVAYMGYSDLIGGVRHQGTSLKWMFLMNGLRMIVASSKEQILIK